MKRAWKVAYAINDGKKKGSKAFLGVAIQIVREERKIAANRQNPICEKCGSSRTVKNGVNAAGSQKYICRSCGHYGTKTRSKAAKLAA